MELPSSALGTKDYWENVYKREVAVFQDIGDAGEEWFGHGSVVKMVKWCVKHGNTTDKVLDVGCGNGHVLLGLKEEGFDNLVGVDYAPSAIELAIQVAVEEFGQDHDIQYSLLDVCDVENLPKDLVGQFDLILDKGTFDAITLDPANKQDGEKPVEQYPESMKRLIKEGGRMLITSCNWTEPELKAHFETRGWKQIDRIAYPTITFGGSTGQTICTLAFSLS